MCFTNLNKHGLGTIKSLDGFERSKWTGLQTWRRMDPSGGPTLSRASSKTFSRCSGKILVTSMSTMPRTGRWSDCFNSARPYQKSSPVRRHGQKSSARTTPRPNSGHYAATTTLSPATSTIKYVYHSLATSQQFCQWGRGSCGSKEKLAHDRNVPGSTPAPSELFQQLAVLQLNRCKRKKMEV